MKSTKTMKNIMKKKIKAITATLALLIATWLWLLFAYAVGL